jgi:ABC-type nitrate/sulfonate/bicarbonate transport system substrate-binding protein
MNSCPYCLVAAASIDDLKDLRGKTVVCREAPARGVPFEKIFHERAGLELGGDVALQLPASDQDAFSLLVSGKAPAALLPRPYGFMAEERGFHRLRAWPDAVDDPLPISIETTAALAREREKDFRAFIEAHREGIRYLKANRNEALRILAAKFNHPPTLAAKTVDDYLVCLDEQLTVDFKQFERLLSQVALEKTTDARQIASEWISPGALTG